MDVVADDGCRLWTDPAIDGPPLVFCHGGPGLSGMRCGHVLGIHTTPSRGMRGEVTRLTYVEAIKAVTRVPPVTATTGRYVNAWSAG